MTTGYSLWRAAPQTALALALLAAGTSVAISPASAQSNAATATPSNAAPWFGLPLPGPATEQIINFEPANGMPTIAAPGVAGSTELDGSKALGYVRDIVRYSYMSRDAGDVVWGRIAGSRWTAMATDYVAQHLQDAGLKVERASVPFTGQEVSPTSWKIEVSGDAAYGAGTSDLSLKSAFPMGYGPEGAGMAPSRDLQQGIAPLKARAQLVYVGSGTAAELAQTDVRGKIALLRLQTAGGLFHSPAMTGVRDLRAAGAAGIMVIYDVPGNLQVRFGACETIPCVSLGSEDGRFLMAALARAASTPGAKPIEASMEITYAPRAETTAEIMVARLPGKEPGEALVLSAHSDSYFAGANDNGSGMAALIALAKHYSASQPKHDIYFILSPGHHSPTGGNAHSLKLHPDLGARALLSVNLEHIGQRGTYVSYFGEGGLGRSTDKYGIHQSTYVGTTGDSPGRELSGQPLTPTMRRIIQEAAVESEFLVTVPMGVFSDPEQRALINAGVPTIQNVETSVWYHTSGDTIETISAETLQRSLLFYRGIVDRADKLSRKELLMK